MPRKMNTTSAKSKAPPKQTEKATTKSKSKTKSPKPTPNKFFDNGTSETMLDLREAYKWLTGGYGKFVG